LKNTIYSTKITKQLIHTRFYAQSTSTKLPLLSRTVMKALPFNCSLSWYQHSTHLLQWTKSRLLAIAVLGSDTTETGTQLFSAKTLWLNSNQNNVNLN